MSHFSSMVQWISKVIFYKKRKNSGDDNGREAANAMAKDAKKNNLILRSPGFVNVDGSNNCASVFSKSGTKGVNHDCAIVWEEFGCQIDMLFCGIFDGHGPWGHFVVKKVRESMPLSMLCNWQETLTQTQTLLNPDIDLESDKKHQRFHIWKHCVDNRQTANIGDSRAVLATTSNDGDLVPIQLTIDFRPNLPEEAERIIQCKGRVFCLHDKPGVHRVWLPDEDSQGLTMSRAFGDYCIKHYGLISVPEVTHRHITSRDQFVVLATYGLWDVISNQEAIEIVSSTPDKAKAAKRLVECAVHAWKKKKKKKKGIVMDDISAICLFLPLI
ncbi:hypothetical protein PTKIN_Ptkin06aG0214500 [Pterospermum kingtungense]